ncbi:YihY/virulence factor BrkB family protein [Microlunatus elymi]|uniref:YihY/virulence factor BrkB family protein n=1 Tax=Microlunatus elymi TaxID=2596828 RepID=A0A516PZQ0_9ACTN|nr:YihY/virulence factor BrkB family protein [Microlunatus elymi]QDP96650.1 YihY/virulence factor BrkB family protein [Microlunatus elymi]
MVINLPRWARTGWRVVVDTVVGCFRYRVTGLAAEAAFFALLSLPPLIFAAVGSLGFVASMIRPEAIQDFKDKLLELASRVLTPSAVETVIAPTINDVLAEGRAAVISIGFLISLWSGSRALNVFIDGIGIMYGQRGHRHFVRARLLSFLLYLVFLVVAMILVPLVLAGPGFVDRILPHPIAWLGALYWPIVLIGSGFFLATLYNLSLPRRYRLCSGLPGAAVALLIWIGGSWVLRVALSRTAATPSIFGPLAAPIALMLWLYVISLAVLIGAAFNSAIDKRRNLPTGFSPKPSA